ncbi:MAG TPA: pyridoxamine 5'-phosphate oxidase family protein [Capillimicrobium sp.]|jgi:PPOX class probable F420-dependent enzyme
MSRRDQIRMTPDEARAFLGEERTMTCATHGKSGWPHLMPLWYVLRGADRDELWAWTYAKSQKVRNLERDPRATVQVEAGTEYHLLRGMMLETEVEIIRDPEAVHALGLEIFTRYGDGSPPTGAVAEMVAAQAAKRVGLRFVERSRVTWDHRKLEGTY